MHRLRSIILLTEHRRRAVLECGGPEASQGELAGTTRTGNTLPSSLDHSGLGNYEQSPPRPLAVSEKKKKREKKSGFVDISV